MKKLKYILPFFLSILIMNGVYFPFNCMPLNKQINDVIYGKKNSKGTKNANKTEDLIKNKKEQIEEIKSDINKKKEKIVEKTEETKKEIDSRTKKATSKLDRLYSELKEKNKNNNKNEDVNTVSLQEYKYCIPLNFTTDSVFERAIITDIVYNKIKDSNILDSSLFSLKDDLNSSYDFFSIALNRNFRPQINLSLDIKEYDRVKEIVDSEKFKDFIDDIDITEKDFNAAKSRIENYLNSCKNRLNQYLTNLDTKNFRLNSTEMLKNAFSTGKFDSNTEDLSIFYSKFFLSFLKFYDRKLYNNIKIKIANNKFDDSYFKETFNSSIKKSKSLITESLNKIDGKGAKNLTASIRETKFDEEFMFIKIHSGSLDKDKVNGEIKGRINLYGIDNVFYNTKFLPIDLFFGFFDALKFDRAKKMEFKSYYNRKLNWIRNEKDIYNEDFKRFLNSLYNNSSNSSEKNDIVLEGEVADFEQFKKNAVEFLDNFKSSIENYYEKFIEKLNRDLK